MRTLRHIARTRRVHTRLCLRCGHDGPELQADPGDAPLTCPRCGQDLYERPARSYAELEAIDDIPAPPPPRPSWSRRQWRLLRAWVTIWMAIVRHPSPR